MTIKNTNTIKAVGIIPTENSKLIPVTGVKLTATRVWANVGNVTVTTKIYTVPSGKIFRFSYFYLSVDHTANQEVMLASYDSGNNLIEYYTQHKPSGLSHDLTCHSFVDKPVLNAGDYIQVNVITTIQNISCNIIGYEETI